jgi:hypothetical protein
MNYLLYVEHAAENLQFYIWFKDYEQRFEALSASQKDLSPEWTEALAEAAASAAHAKSFAEQNLPLEAAGVLKGTELDNVPKAIADQIMKQNPFTTPSVTASDASTYDEEIDFSYSTRSSVWSGPRTGSNAGSHRSMGTRKGAASAYEGADQEWQPCSYCPQIIRLTLTNTFTVTMQPFREEISRIMVSYIADGSPRELNISSRDRATVLHALEHTTHPSAFRSLLTTCEFALRRQAHPNFIRWTICNANKPRVIFVSALAYGAIFFGLVSVILLTLSTIGRAWRVVPAVGLILGIASIIGAWKGMCIVLLVFHHRHLRPWESLVSDEGGSNFGFSSELSCELKKEAFGSLQPAQIYEDEPWVAKYEKRNILSKIFDREVWVQEPALREIQDTLFFQSVVCSLVFTAFTVGAFVAIPSPNLF